MCAPERCSNSSADSQVHNTGGAGGLLYKRGSSQLRCCEILCCVGVTVPQGPSVPFQGQPVLGFFLRVLRAGRAGVGLVPIVSSGQVGQVLLRVDEKGTVK